MQVYSLAPSFNPELPHWYVGPSTLGSAEGWNPQPGRLQLGADSCGFESSFGLFSPLHTQPGFFHIPWDEMIGKH